MTDNGQNLNNSFCLIQNPQGTQEIYFNCMMILTQNYDYCQIVSYNKLSLLNNSIMNLLILFDKNKQIFIDNLKQIFEILTKNIFRRFPLNEYEFNNYKTNFFNINIYLEDIFFKILKDGNFTEDIVKNYINFDLIYNFIKLLDSPLEDERKKNLEILTYIYFNIIKRRKIFRNCINKIFSEIKMNLLFTDITHLLFVFVLLEEIYDKLKFKEDSENEDLYLLADNLIEIINSKYIDQIYITLYKVLKTLIINDPKKIISLSLLNKLLNLQSISVNILNLYLLALTNIKVDKINNYIKKFIQKILFILCHKKLIFDEIILKFFNINNFKEIIKKYIKLFYNYFLNIILDCSEKKELPILNSTINIIKNELKLLNKKEYNNVINNRAKNKNKSNKNNNKEKKFINNEDNFLENMCCPITNSTFIDPVITPFGQTYEKNAIEKWIEKYHTSPITKKHLEINSLIPNYALKNLIEEYKKLNK